jgi:hypothetical protein
MPIEKVSAGFMERLHACLHKTHHVLHSQGEGWGHRVYLGLVGVEVKYWYGKAAIAILVIEAICWVLATVDKE